MAAAPFNGIDRLNFKLQGPADTRRLHNLTKIGSGSATLVLKGDYTRQEKRRFVVQIQTTGAVGAATFRWSKDGGLTWDAGGLISGDRQHPVALWGGLEVYWEAGRRHPPGGRGLLDLLGRRARGAPPAAAGNPE